jgi:hypothetical protein
MLPAGVHSDFVLDWQPKNVSIQSLYRYTEHNGVVFGIRQSRKYSLTVNWKVTHTYHYKGLERRQL